MIKEDKILQIIPVSTPVFALYEDKEAPNGYFASPVCCYALVEDKEGLRSVRAMELAIGDGSIDFVDATDNFMGLSYNPNPESVTASP